MAGLPFLKGAKLLKKASGLSHSTIYSKPGGLSQAAADFASLPGTAQQAGNVMVKRMPDGSKAVLRSFSTDGRSTLEIQGPCYPLLRWSLTDIQSANLRNAPECRADVRNALPTGGQLLTEYRETVAGPELVREYIHLGPS